MHVENLLANATHLGISNRKSLTLPSYEDVGTISFVCATRMMCIQGYPSDLFRSCNAFAYMAVCRT